MSFNVSVEAVGTSSLFSQPSFLKERKCAYATTMLHVCVCMSVCLLESVRLSVSVSVSSLSDSELYYTIEVN
jgi:hypothetical protein